MILSGRGWGKTRSRAEWVREQVFDKGCKRIALIGENGYGHSNIKSFDQFTADELKELGLSSNPGDILAAGKFQIPQSQEFETRMNKEFEQIMAGF